MMKKKFMRKIGRLKMQVKVKNPIKYIELLKSSIEYHTTSIEYHTIELERSVVELKEVEKSIQHKIKEIE
jgi:hypothetical protein